MHTKKLGNTDLTPSVLGFGCARIASVTTLYPKKEIVATLHEALDRGITFFDTADVYGQGDSERLLGKIVRGRRDQVIICTKAGLTLRAPQVVVRWVKPLANVMLRHWRPVHTAATGIRERNEHQCFEPAYICKRIQDSLRRLGTDYLDIFLLHNPPPEIITNGAIFEVLEKVKQSGAIRYYGVSCESPDEARLCLRQSGVSCLQLAANLINRDAIEDIFSRARTSRVGIVAREPFSGGEIFSYPPLLDVCTMNHANRSPAHVALQCLLQRDDIGVVLPGMTCRKHLFENLTALEAPVLTTDEIQRLHRTQGLLS